MSESNEQARAAHFLGFAKLLYQDICDELGNYFVISEDLNERQKQAFLTLIAQRVYDLFIYDRMNTGTSDLQHAASRYEAELLVEGVPDMTAWLEQDKNSEEQ